MDPFMRIARLFPALLLLPLLSACSNSLQTLHEAKPNGDDYLSALAAEYMAYAESEKEQGRIFKGEYFAKKGVSALDGNNVEPEEVQNDLTPPEARTLAKARQSLVALQTDDMKHFTPRKLARAQLLFDCWQNQLVRRANQETVPCADEFSSTLLELQKMADSSVTGAETTHIVSFASKSTRLSSASAQVLDEVVARAKEYDQYTLQLDGHLEEMLPGSADHRLTVARMEAVRKALVVRGIDDENIELLKARALSPSTPVMLSSDRPSKPHSIDINLRTYSAGEKQ